MFTYNDTPDFPTTIFEGSKIESLLKSHIKLVDPKEAEDRLEEAYNIGETVSDAVLKKFGWRWIYSGQKVAFSDCCVQFLKDNLNKHNFNELNVYIDYENEFLRAVDGVWDNHIEISKENVRRGLR